MVDLSGVSFIDTAGLDPLLEAQWQLAGLGRSLTLRAVPQCMARLMELLGEGNAFGAPIPRAPETYLTHSSAAGRGERAANTTGGPRHEPAHSTVSNLSQEV